MIALLLAQLVMPSPSVEPLSPPGMVCMGECSDGPMVWRASPARGRLVVACDMRSSTCSDGRRIATTRSTPVPCEVSPGVWEMVPEDTACISYRGLEVWASTTSYLSWGAELDRSPWGSIRGGTLQPVADGWQVSNDPSQSNSGWVYMGGAADEGVTYTVACRVRAETPTTLRVSPLDAGGSDCPLHQVGAEWATVSCTQTAGAGRGERAHIWPGVGQEGPASVIVAACWLTKTDTPGRPCWGGEAPVHCDGEWVRMSTDGFPTKSGEIIITFRPGESNNSRYLFDTRDSGSTPSYGVGIYLTPSDGLVAVFCAGSCSNKNTSVTLIDGENHVRYRWSETRAEVWLNGDKVLDWEPSVTIEAHRSMVAIGSHASSKINHLNGSVSSFIVRSYE